jgi:hypothetical protein
MRSQKTDRHSEHEIVSWADWPEKSTMCNGLASDAVSIDAGSTSQGRGCNELQEREIQAASQSRWRQP